MTSPRPVGVKLRNYWQVTLATYHALALREASTRLTKDRMAWFWMMLEPIAFVSFMSLIRSAVSAHGPIYGVEFVPWVSIGMISFMMCRDSITTGMHAIKGGKGLFCFRQIQPVDIVLASVVAELVLKSAVLSVFITVLAMLGFEVLPDKPLEALGLWFVMWLFGSGLALWFSVLTILVGEIAYLVRISMIPLMIVSGALIPLHSLPYEYQSTLFLNPISHGVELIRAAFFDIYHMPSQVDLAYLLSSTLVIWSTGLLMQVAMARKVRSL